MFLKNTPAVSLKLNLRKTKGLLDTITIIHVEDYDNLDNVNRLEQSDFVSILKVYATEYMLKA